MSELQRLENCVAGRAKLRVWLSDWLSITATLRLAVDDCEPKQASHSAKSRMIEKWWDLVRKAARRLSPAGPPPTQTTSYNSGVGFEVVKLLRCRRS